MRPIVLALTIFASACTTSSSTAMTPVGTPATTASTAQAKPSGAVALAAGTVDIPAANSFGDDGFHESVAISAQLPNLIAEGTNLTLRLFDAGRPDQSCDSDHPLSGCVTVDWSDFKDRPNVPSGGVFDNHLTLQLASGPLTLFLSETGVLSPIPDAYSPG